MKLLSLLMVLLFAFGCSKENANEVLASSASAGIALALQCKNPAVIKADILAALEKKSEVKSIQSGGQLACEIIVANVLPLILQAGVQQIPATWGCSGRVDSITELARKACSMVKF